MRNGVALGLAVVGFALGALVAGAAAQAGPMAGWSFAEMMDFCRRMTAGA